MENKTETITAPGNYVYPQGTKVEMDGFFLMDLIKIFDTLVKEEITTESKFKFNYVNEKGKVVKSPKVDDIATGKVKKILDFERTIINPTLDHSISEKGIAYAELKNFLEGMHYQNIKKGIAVDYEKLAETLIDKGDSTEE